MNNLLLHAKVAQLIIVRHFLVERRSAVGSLTCCVRSYKVFVFVQRCNIDLLSVDLI